MIRSRLEFTGLHKSGHNSPLAQIHIYNFEHHTEHNKHIAFSTKGINKVLVMVFDVNRCNDSLTKGVCSLIIRQVFKKCQNVRYTTVRNLGFRKNKRHDVHIM